MNLNDEKGTDPTVEAIVEMFPEDFLRNTARESELVQPPPPTTIQQSSVIHPLS